MSNLHLKVVTPTKVFFDDDIEMLIARGLNGDFAIMKNHVPLIAALDIRDIKIKQNGKFEIAAIAGGYLTFKDNNITIMSDAVEWRKDIDRQRALIAKEKAEDTLAKAKEAQEIDRAEISLKKAINRLKVSE